MNAVEHPSSRGNDSSPTADGAYGNVLNYTGKGEALLWAVGEVQEAIDGVVVIAETGILTIWVFRQAFKLPIFPIWFPRDSVWAGWNV